MQIYKIIPIILSVALSGCANTDAKWFDLFNSDSSVDTTKAKAPTVDKAWLDHYEPLVSNAIKDTNFTLKRTKSALIVTVPVETCFNADRPAMMLPSSLGPTSNLAKLLEHDKEISVLILGYTGEAKSDQLNTTISNNRANSMAAVFRMSGAGSDRLAAKGLGSDETATPGDIKQGNSSLNRVDIILTPKGTMTKLLTEYEKATGTDEEKTTK